MNYFPYTQYQTYAQPYPAPMYGASMVASIPEPKRIDTEPVFKEVVVKIYLRIFGADHVDFIRNDR